MDAIEQSELAVDELIPKNVKHWQTPAVKAILGSFQSLPTNKYDFVLALGAIHHTPDLDKTAQKYFLCFETEWFFDRSGNHRCLTLPHMRNTSGNIR